MKFNSQTNAPHSGRGGGGFNNNKGDAVKLPYNNFNKNQHHPQPNFHENDNNKRTFVNHHYDNENTQAFRSSPSHSFSTSLTEVPLFQEQKQSSRPQVFTEIREDGTEVPQRLNNKVFIDGLPFNYNPDEHAGRSFEDVMAQFISDWKVGKMIHFTKKPGQGFGYVAFRSPNSVEVAIRVLNGRKLFGRSLRVELPKTAREGASAAPKPGSFAETFLSSVATAHRQVLISDLSKNSDPDIIRQIIRDAAPQMERKIDVIKMTGHNRKAFLTLESEADVEPLVNFLNGYKMLGRTIAATKAQAPGTLPYSKVVAPRPTTINIATNNNIVVAVAASHPDDDILPLGATLPPTTQTPAVSAADISSFSKSVTANQRTAFTSHLSVPIAHLPPHSLKGTCNVYVGNLPESARESALRSHFSHCGVIKSINIITNPHTHASTGVAVVTFALPSSAVLAIETLNCSRLHDCVLQVDDGDSLTGVVSDGSGGSGGKIKKSMSKAFNDNAEDYDKEIDEDAYLRSRGIRNPKKYFESVPKVSVGMEKKNTKLGRERSIKEMIGGRVEESVEKITMMKKSKKGGDEGKKMTLKRQRSQDEEIKEKDIVVVKGDSTKKEGKQGKVKTIDVADKIIIKVSKTEKEEEMSAMKASHKEVVKQHKRAVVDFGGYEDYEYTGDAFAIHNDNISNSKEKMTVEMSMSNENNNDEEEHFVDVDKVRGEKVKKVKDAKTKKN